MNVSGSLYKNEISKSYKTNIDILDLWKKQNESAIQQQNTKQ